MSTATKISFVTMYGEKPDHETPTGNGMQNEYGYDMNSKGQKVLVKTGEKNLYEEIQSYLEETKIENVLKRVAVGDMSDFRPQGIYQDVTEIPNNLIEARREMLKLENMWNKLPNETKAKYDFSVETFIAEAGKESWLVDMGYINPAADETTPELTDPVEEIKKAEPVAAE